MGQFYGDQRKNYDGVKMRIILSALAIVFLSTIGSAQTGPSPTPTPPAEVYELSSTPDRRLPVLKFKPKITLQNALKLAEELLKKEKPKGMNHHLLEAKLIEDLDDRAPFAALWLFTWKHESVQPAFDIQITVSMSGKITMRPNTFLGVPRQKK